MVVVLIVLCVVLFLLFAYQTWMRADTEEQNFILKQQLSKCSVDRDFLNSIRKQYLKDPNKLCPSDIFFFLFALSFGIAILGIPVSKIGLDVYKGISDKNLKSYESGYVDGYSDGKDDGYDSGYDDGYLEAASKVSYGTTKYGDDFVYVTIYGDHYHRKGCEFLEESRITKRRSDARVEGYEPCSYCDP